MAAGPAAARMVLAGSSGERGSQKEASRAAEYEEIVPTSAKAPRLSAEALPEFRHAMFSVQAAFNELRGGGIDSERSMEEGTEPLIQDKLLPAIPWLLEVPEELLRRIISFCSAKELCALCCVCHACKRIALEPYMWQRLFERRFASVAHTLPTSALQPPDGSSWRELYFMRGQDWQHLAVASHASEDSCWILIDKQIYDVTSFLNQHPGMAASLLLFAGGDASEVFAEVAHSRPALQLMETMRLARLELPSEGCPASLLPTPARCEAACSAWAQQSIHAYSMAAATEAAAAAAEAAQQLASSFLPAAEAAHHFATSLLPARASFHPAAVAASLSSRPSPTHPSTTSPSAPPAPPALSAVHSVHSVSHGLNFDWPTHVAAAATAAAASRAAAQLGATAATASAKAAQIGAACAAAATAATAAARAALPTSLPADAHAWHLHAAARGLGPFADGSNYLRSLLPAAGAAQALATSLFPADPPPWADEAHTRTHPRTLLAEAQPHAQA